MIIYRLISIVAIRLAAERETRIVGVMDRICSEVMRGSLADSCGLQRNLGNISERSVMNCREGIEVCKVSGHLILGSSICGSLNVGISGQEASLPFVTISTSAFVWDIRHFGR